MVQRQAFHRMVNTQADSSIILDFGIYSAPSIFSESPSKDEGPFIPFSTYPAVRAHGLEQLGREELSFLEQKGCLLLPKKPVLDQFLQQYFLRVHPILPVLRESDIRSAFLGCSPSSTLQGPVALVIMQAILFLASPVSCIEIHTLRSSNQIIVCFRLDAVCPWAPQRPRCPGPLLCKDKSK